MAITKYRSDLDTFEVLDYIVYAWAFWTFLSDVFFGPIVRQFIAKKLLIAELGHNLFIMLQKEIDNFGKKAEEGALTDDYCLSHESNRGRARIGHSSTMRSTLTKQKTKIQKFYRKPDETKGEAVV